MNFAIKKIKVENFRCIENLETELWHRTKVSSDNEGGKTTLASAILWTLTGKDADGNSTFEIVPSGEYGKVSPAVTLGCTIDDKPVTFKREYKAKFARDKSFKEYVTACYINDLEVGARKFQEYISSHICDESVFKILSNPYTFVENCPKEQKELLWQAQRRILMSMVENVSDADIAKEDAKWEKLSEALVRYDNANQYLSYLKQQTSTVQKDVDSFEARMEQQQSNIIETAYTKIEAKAFELNFEKQLKELDERESVSGAENMQKQIEQTRREIEKLLDEKESIKNEYRLHLNEAETQQRKFNADAGNKAIEAESWTAKQAQYADAVERLKQTKVSEYCETCKQRLSTQAIQAHRNAIMDRIRKGTACVENARKNAVECIKKKDELISAAESVKFPVYPVAEIDEIDRKISELYANIQKCSVNSETEKFDEERERLNRLLADTRQIMYNIESNEKCKDKIAELKAEHRKNMDALNELQMLTDLCKDFITSKCKRYESEINKLFPNVRFQLFEQNKSNDDIREVCNLTFRGHKYEDLSASTKLVANMELVKALQNHYGVTTTLILDNMESCTAEIKNDAQIIKMYVKEEFCPKCGGKSGRRNPDGTWKCEKCGSTWKKSLEIVEEQS